VIAPLLAEALEHDGRGSFGCVAINPPTFLAEDEALELIRTELKAAGLALDESVELDAVPQPKGSRYNREYEKDAGEDEDPEPFISPHKRRLKLQPASREFDFADRKRAVYVEYLSRRDYDDWYGPAMSTAQYYDFPGFAEGFSDALRERKSGDAAVFGVFFDPLANDDIPAPDTAGLEPELQRLADEAHADAVRLARETIEDRAKEKLRRQVRQFVAFLTEQGVVPEE
jgi:hypothetical protein